MLHKSNFRFRVIYENITVGLHHIDDDDDDDNNDVLWFNVHLKAGWRPA